jgi:predicted nucleic acid-binding protein
MDDFLARKQAIRLDLLVMGTVRMLYIAEQRDLISSAEAVISDMRNYGYRISTAILEKIRRERN